MRGLALVVAAFCAVACAHVRGGEEGTAGGEPLVASAAPAKMPPACGETLQVQDPMRLLSFDERLSLSSLDAACAQLAELAWQGGRCRTSRLEAVAGARREALGQAQAVARARQEGDVDGAQSASLALRRLAENVGALADSACEEPRP